MRLLWALLVLKSFLPLASWGLADLVSLGTVYSPLNLKVDCDYTKICLAQQPYVYVGPGYCKPNLDSKFLEFVDEIGCRDACTKDPDCKSWSSHDSDENDMKCYLYPKVPRYTEGKPQWVCYSKVTALEKHHRPKQDKEADQAPQDSDYEDVLVKVYFEIKNMFTNYQWQIIIVAADLDDATDYLGPNHPKDMYGNPLPNYNARPVVLEASYFPNKKQWTTKMYRANESYHVGPNVPSSPPDDCDQGGWTGTLEEAQNKCNLDKNCQWLHSTDCLDTGTEWRFCGNFSTPISKGDGAACSKLKNKVVLHEIDACEDCQGMSLCGSPDTIKDDAVGLPDDIRATIGEPLLEWGCHNVTAPSSAPPIWENSEDHKLYYAEIIPPMTGQMESLDTLATMANVVTHGTVATGFAPLNVTCNYSFKGLPLFYRLGFKNEEDPPEYPYRLLDSGYSRIEEPVDWSAPGGLLDPQTGMLQVHILRDHLHFRPVHEEDMEYLISFDVGITDITATPVYHINFANNTITGYCYDSTDGPQALFRGEDLTGIVTEVFGHIPGHEDAPSRQEVACSYSWMQLLDTMDPYELLVNGTFGTIPWRTQEARLKFIKDLFEQSGPTSSETPNPDVEWMLSDKSERQSCEDACNTKGKGCTDYFRLRLTQKEFVEQAFVKADPGHACNETEFFNCWDKSMNEYPLSSLMSADISVTACFEASRAAPWQRMGNTSNIQGYRICNIPPYPGSCTDTVFNEAREELVPLQGRQRLCACINPFGGTPPAVTPRVKISWVAMKPVQEEPGEGEGNVCSDFDEPRCGILLPGKTSGPKRQRVSYGEVELERFTTKTKAEKQQCYQGVGGPSCGISNATHYAALQGGPNPSIRTNIISNLTLSWDLGEDTMKICAGFAVPTERDVGIGMVNKLESGTDFIVLKADQGSMRDTYATYFTPFEEIDDTFTLDDLYRYPHSTRGSFFIWAVGVYRIEGIRVICWTQGIQTLGLNTETGVSALIHAFAVEATTSPTPMEVKWIMTNHALNWLSGTFINAWSMRNKVPLNDKWKLELRWKKVSENHTEICLISLLEQELPEDHYLAIGFSPAANSYEMYGMQTIVGLPTGACKFGMSFRNEKPKYSSALGPTTVKTCYYSQQTLTSVDQPSIHTSLCLARRNDIPNSDPALDPPVQSLYPDNWVRVSWAVVKVAQEIENGTLQLKLRKHEYGDAGSDLVKFGSGQNCGTAHEMLDMQWFMGLLLFGALLSALVNRLGHSIFWLMHGTLFPTLPRSPSRIGTISFLWVVICTWFYADFPSFADLLGHGCQYENRPPHVYTDPGMIGRVLGRWAIAYMSLLLWPIAKNSALSLVMPWSVYLGRRMHVWIALTFGAISLVHGIHQTAFACWEPGGHHMTKRILYGWLLFAVYIAMGLVHRIKQKRYHLFFVLHSNGVWVVLVLTFLHLATGSGTFSLYKAFDILIVMAPSTLWYVYQLKIQPWLKRGKWKFSLIRADTTGEIMELYIISSGRKSFKYKAGQWVNVLIPDNNKRHWHPFAISSAPHDHKEKGQTSFTLHMKAGGSRTWTGKLKLLASTLADNDVVDDVSLKVKIEGPYNQFPLSVYSGRYKAVLLIAYGMGFTCIHPVFCQMYHQRHINTGVKKVFFVWVLKHKWMVSHALDPKVAEATKISDSAENFHFYGYNNDERYLNDGITEGFSRSSPNWKTLLGHVTKQCVDLQIAHLALIIAAKAERIQEVNAAVQNVQETKVKTKTFEVPLATHHPDRSAQNDEEMSFFKAI